MKFTTLITIVFTIVLTIAFTLVNLKLDTSEASLLYLHNNKERQESAKVNNELKLIFNCDNY